MAWSRPFLLAIFLFVLASVARAQGFAVQVAAFGSQREAELAVTALRSRNVEAVWIKTDASFRIRVGGRFANSQEATAFATKLVSAGLIASYTIQPYDQSVIVPTSNPLPTNHGHVDGLSGHALPARAVQAKATPVPRTDAPTVNNIGVTPNKPAPRVYADDVNLDDLAEFSDAQLESKIEKKGDRLLLYVRNHHGRNLFRGTVKLTLQDGGKDSTVEPWQFMLKAKEDSTYDLNAVVRQSGSYWVEVLDDRGRTQMIKAASLEPRQPKTELANKKDDTPNNLSIATEVVDEDVPPKNALLRVASDNGDGMDAPEAKTAAGDEGKEVSKENIQQGDVKVIVRKVAESAENVTLEFEIQAPAPLGMISVAMQTASTTDFKQAIMTTKLGRIPFLVPISDTNGAFNFELKDESGRILASGQKSFQEFKKP